MNEFVEECRREWKRLEVPDAIANEMAADLEADLKEAEAEGASPEVVLGSGAFDPRAFAASWAAARGVARPTAAGVSQRMPRARPGRRVGVLAVLAGSAVVGLVVLVGAALVVASPVMGRVSFPRFPGMRVGLLVLFVLLVGIVGLTVSALFWRLWDNTGRWSRPRHDRDQTPENQYS